MNNQPCWPGTRIKVRERPDGVADTPRRTVVSVPGDVLRCLHRGEAQRNRRTAYAYGEYGGDSYKYSQ